MAAAAATISLCASRCLGPSPSPRPQSHLASRLLVERTRCRRETQRPSLPRRRRLAVLAATKGSAKSSGKADEQVPSWARPGSDEPPPWARGEGGDGPPGEAAAVQVPFYAYLLASTVTAIAAIGSIFEYTNQKPVFGVVGTDSPLYAPILGFFAITGIPTAGYLWFKAVQTANKDAEEQDRKDGFL